MKFGPSMRLERMKVAPPGSISTEAGCFYGSEGGKRVPDEDYGESYWFWCPGCETHHSFRTKNPKGESPKFPTWQFNGNMDKPTFTPSLLCNKDYPESRCHLHLRAGVIEYCSDCHHDLKGKKVPLPPLE